ncbi:MAG: VTT domain-containing protein [Phycisphaerales bacterium]|jgi:uncharacterized membrane protein YdjX (TVP38/TMEM64 family)|nr:VTT domain-containing protein [Phycisphaerales bacterium]
MTKTSSTRSLGPAGLLAVFWVVCPAALGFVLIANLATATAWLDSVGPAAPLLFAAFFAVTSGLGLLPTYAQAVVAGWVFGAGIGLVSTLGGFVGGAVIGWAVARLVSSSRVEQAIDRHPKAKVITQALVGRGFWPTLGIVTLIRIPPNSPFALTNLAVAACGVSLPVQTIGTAVGMTPRSAVIVFMSAAAAASGAEDLQSFIADGPGAWVLVGGIVAMLIVLGIIASIAQRALARVAGRSG